MEYALAFLVGTAISWIGLIIVIPIAQRIAEFSLPPWLETLWKLAVIAGAGNLVAILLDPVHFFLSWVVGFVVFWWLMVKWFDVDFFGAVIIVVVSWVIRILLMALIMGALIGITS